MKRNVSTPHLVLGIVFAGIAALWMIAQTTDANIHDTAPGFPLVLIGAGAIGLVATLSNARNRNRAAAESEVGSEADEPETDQPESDQDEDDLVDEATEPTTVITTEENR